MSLSLKITVDATDYYLSNQEYISITGNNYHFPFVTKSPKLSMKAVKGGFIQIEVGNITIENAPNDSNHPFSGSRFTDLISTPQNYPFVLNFGESNYDFLTGVLTLSSFNQNQLFFTLDQVEYDFKLASTVTDKDSNTVVNPFSFGVVTHGTPVVQKSGTTFANPGLGTSGVTIYENGVAMTISGNDGTTITVSSYSGGEVSISGTSDNGTTLEDFFDYVANTIGIDTTTADTTRATNASSLTFSAYENSRRQLLTFAGEVAEAHNHQFIIRIDENDVAYPTTLFLIDRDNSSTATALDEYDVLSFSIDQALPLEGVSATYEVTSPANGLLQRKRQNLNSSANAIGRDIKVSAFADTTAQRAGIEALLDSVRDIEKKPLVSFSVAGIQEDYKHGDRFTFNRYFEFLTVDILARSINYNFDTETTTVTGEADLTAYTQS